VRRDREDDRDDDRGINSESSRRHGKHAKPNKGKGHDDDEDDFRRND
jgi:hypothetical protein